MCDYSLSSVASRPAVVGDRLETTAFPQSITHGFCGADHNVAVCLIPGTQLGFADNITERVPGIFGLKAKDRGAATAKFIQVNMDSPYSHHDALELPNGEVVMVNNLVEGQHASVLQLPAAPKTAEEAKAQERAAFV